MVNNFSNMSLYAKLRDGRYRMEFPEDFFPTVTFCDGVPSIPTARWKKIDIFQGCYEWTIFCTQDFEIIGDYMNGACKFYPNWYMLRFRSAQNSLMDIAYDSIYDLSSENYSPININMENGQKALTPRQYFSEAENMQERFALRNSRSVVMRDDHNIKRYIIPITLDINSKAPFEGILDDVRSGKTPLPPII